ncbi:MAG: hypothetical protein AAF628_04855 [Planctomycetota bacterium]
MSPTLNIARRPHPFAGAGRALLKSRGPGRCPAWRAGWRLVAAALLAAPVATQTELTFFDGARLDQLTLRSVDEADRAAVPRTLLADVELLDAEISNRTTQQELRPDRPRAKTVQGVTWVELPDGRGRLIRYRRAGASLYGVLWVDERGHAVTLFELPSTSGGDPLADRFGLANDGLHAGLVSATGALHIARLDGGTYAGGRRTRLVPLSNPVDPVSVCVGRTCVWFQTTDATVWRCAFTDGALPEDVTPTAAPGSLLATRMAPSGDGSLLAFVLGPDKAEQIWLVDADNPARNLGAPPADYEEPGYLPEMRGGPKLLLNDDGTRLLYVDRIGHDEVYLADTTGVLPTLQVTGDGIFEPYIGIIIFPSFAGSAMTGAIGYYTGVDWYTVSLEGPVGVENLSLTGPSPVPPWFPGGLDVRAARTTSTGVVLSTEAVADDHLLRAVNPFIRASARMGTPLRGLPGLGRADGADPNVVLPMQGGDWLVQSALVPLLLSPSGVFLSPDTLAPSGAYSAMVVSTPLGLSAALLVVPGFGLVALPADPSLRGVHITAGDGLVLDAAQLQYLRPGFALAIPSVQPIRIVVS